MNPQETKDVTGVETVTQTIDTNKTGGNKDSNDVSHQSSLQKKWLNDSELPRTLLKGTKGMKEAGKTFLPQNELESTKGYNNRKSRSVLLNGFRKTASYLAGQVFQRGIVFDDKTSEKIIEYSKNIDTAGNDANVFLKRYFQNGIGKGVSLVMVDTPINNNKNMTVEEEKKLGVRPFAKEIKPENLLGGIVDENGKLIQVRIKENTLKQVGLYGSELVERVRVLTPGAWEIHEKDNNDDYVKISEGTYNHDLIPLVPFIPGEEETQLTGETPLMDLAELNLSHWQSSSDQKNILHVGRVPILFGKKIDLDTIVVGAGGALVSDEEGADLKFVEIVGNAIAAGQTDLTETEAKMALYGLQQLIPRSGSQTATEKVLTSSESNSSLGTWATEFESSVEAIFNLFAILSGEQPQTDFVQVNKEFAFGAFDAQVMNSLLSTYETGIISAQTCLKEFKRRGFLDESIEWADIQEEKEEEARTANTGNEAEGNFFGVQE